jgi:type II secretory pathway component PulF
MARIGLQPLARMLYRVGTSIHAGVDLRGIWDKETMRGTPGYRQQATIVRDRIDAGDNLAEALGACGGYFPPLVRDLTDVGEKTGRLEEVLLGLAQHYEHLMFLRRTFLFGIAWPSLQLLMALGVIGLLIYVLGMIGSGAGSEPVDILGFGLVGGRGLVIYVVLVALVFGSMGLAAWALLRGWFGTAPIQLAMQIPVLGGYLRTSALSRFAWTFSLTLDSGLDAQRAMKLSLRSTQNPFYQSAIPAVDQALVQGREFHESLRATGLFPDDFLDSLEAAEVAGTPGETMSRLADDYRTRAATAAGALTMAATVGVWVTVGAFIILMIFRLAFFYLSTLNEALKGF